MQNTADLCSAWGSSLISGPIISDSSNSIGDDLIVSGGVSSSRLFGNNDNQSQEQEIKIFNVVIGPKVPVGVATNTDVKDLSLTHVKSHLQMYRSVKNDQLAMSSMPMTASALVQETASKRQSLRLNQPNYDPLEMSASSNISGMMQTPPANVKLSLSSSSQGNAETFSFLYSGQNSRFSRSQLDLEEEDRRFTANNFSIYDSLRKIPTFSSLHSNGTDQVFIGSNLSSSGNNKEINLEHATQTAADSSSFDEWL